MSPSDSRGGFRVGGRPGDLFESAAPYYAKFRRSYPEPLVERLVERCGLDGRGRLVDIGCGTGQVFLALARWFHDVIAVDPDPGMVAHARAASEAAGLRNVDVRESRAEDLGPEVAPLRMAAFGSSFHWTDRARVADVIHDLLEPRGELVLLGSASIYSGRTAWERAIRDVLEEHFAGERRAGGGVFRAAERHEEVLRRTRFASVEATEVIIEERWSLDEILGYLYSTSYASKAVLSEHASSFERAVRERLLALEQGGGFHRTASYSLIIARRG